MIAERLRYVFFFLLRLGRINILCTVVLRNGGNGARPCLEFLAVLIRFNFVRNMFVTAFLFSWTLAI